MTSTTDNDERSPVSPKPSAGHDEQEVRTDADAPSSQKDAAVPAQRRGESSRSESVTGAVDAEETCNEESATAEVDAEETDAAETKSRPGQADSNASNAEVSDADQSDAALSVADAISAEAPDAEASEAAALDANTDAPDEGGRQPLSPSQARRIRMRVAGAFMAIAAVVLVVRLSDQPSVLVMGVYGAALILCGVVIELSRRGRTRLGMWMLAGGLVAVALADQWLRSV